VAENVESLTGKQQMSTTKLQFVVDLLRAAFSDRDGELAKYKAIAADASAQAAANAKRADDLQAALDQGKIDHAKELAAEQAAAARGLDEITSVLEEFKIKPAADVFSEAVAASPAIETPAAVVEAAAVIADPAIETPAAVVEAAVEATVEAIGAVFEVPAL
jgi:hypothetical protein